ncbi:alpha/beta hydrolase [Telluribacter sp. SYSU D00476]|uniref:alpha/beta hydrolase n=1 Tax=Telluribacter sp. SYSU D00476 TaxID=2811430 RepID=UPI001FF1CA46|nr:alpha/beta hydrolase [Telluribacter sp. SYSU D00476]
MPSKRPTTTLPLTLPLLGVLLVTLAGCSLRSVHRTKDITYTQADAAKNVQEQQLNVFAPRKRDAIKNVLVFFHGGSWNSGNKDLYNFFGNRWVRKGIVTVVVGYPLSPQANYHQMATAAAQAVNWVRDNIRQYGGDPERIFVSGHSAGGHLAALISLDKEYFNTLGIANPIKGTILIDAAGLDMHGYLMEQRFDSGHTYLQTFTTSPEVWKKASPMYHLHEGMPPMLIYRGGRTYPSIIKSTERFITALKTHVPAPNYHIQQGRRHVGMILQFFFTWNPRYDQMRRFMEE